MSKKTGTTGTPKKTASPCCVYDFTLFDEITQAEVRKTLSILCKKYCFQLEKGEQTEKLHFQGRMSLKNKKRMTELINQLKELGWTKYHVSITSKECRDNNFYVSKEETRVDGPFTNENEVYIPSDVLKMTTLRPWQQSLLDTLTPYSERSVDIVYDPIGNNGKSQISRYLMSYHDAESLPFCNDYKDIMRMAYDVGPKKIYIIDLPRAISKEKLFQFFSGVETLKSGYCFDDRYKFTRRLFEKPRVCIFTNTYPDISLMSNDMWNIWTINNSKLEKLETRDKKNIKLAEAMLDD